jgi:hypothetical protein
LDASEGVLSIVDTVRDATKDLELAYPVIGASSRILRKTAPYLKSGVGRAVFPVIIALDIWSIGSALREDDSKFGRDTTLAVGETAGGWIGYFSGFYSGMAAGAIIGSILCPGPGTAIGAVGGAILGAVVGSALGSKIGEDIAERTYEAKPALLASLSNFKSKISKISLPSINIPKISPTGFINTVRENAAGFVEAAKSRIADLQERAVNNVNGVINTARNLQDGAVSTVEGVVNAAKNLEKKVTSPVSNVVNTVKAAVKNAAEKVINTANRIVNAAKNAVNNTVGIFKNWASGLFG